MYTLLFIIFFHLFNVVLPIEAGDYNAKELPKRFDSEVIQRLYSLYKIDTLTPIDTINQNGRVSLFYEIPGSVPGKIKVISERETIKHIGLQLFTPQEFNAYDPIASFMELYLLRQYATQFASKDEYDFMFSDKISVKVNGTLKVDLDRDPAQLADVLRVLKNRRGCDLTIVDFEYQFYCTTADNSRLQMTLPADIELISNKDKKELEDAFFNEVNSLNRNREVMLACTDAPDRSQLVAHSRGLFRTTGGSLVPGLRSEQYYGRQGLSTKLKLVGLEDNSLEGISNMFTCPSTGNTTLRLDHKMYGGNSNTKNVNLYAFLQAFIEDHEIYVGFEEIKENQIDATIVLMSQEFTYQHVMIVENVGQMLATGNSSSLQSTLYTYIPNGNVDDLFGAFIDRDGEKIEVRTN